MNDVDLSEQYEPDPDDWCPPEPDDWDPDDAEYWGADDPNGGEPGDPGDGEPGGPDGGEPPAGPNLGPLDEVIAVVRRHFPDLVEETIIALSLASTLLLGDLQNPVGLNLVGPPASGKTTIGLPLRRSRSRHRLPDRRVHAEVVRLTHREPDPREARRDRPLAADPAQAADRRRARTPVRAPPRGPAAELLRAQTRVRRRGPADDSGVHGKRGYAGDYHFAWLGCTTPIERHVWKAMGQLGSRFLFVHMPEQERSSSELAEALTAAESYRTSATSAGRASPTS